MPEARWKNTVRLRHHRHIGDGDVPAGWIAEQAREFGVSRQAMGRFVATIRANQGLPPPTAWRKPTPKQIADAVEQARQEHLAKLRASNPAWSHYQPRIYRDPGGYSHAG